MAPKAAKKAHVLKNHDHERIDDYYWLKERDNPEVIKYLEEENKHLKASLSHLDSFQHQLYDEMKSRIKKNDDSVPYQMGEYEYWYRYEDQKEYEFFCRKHIKDNREEVILDVNALAEGQSFCNVSSTKISHNGQYLAYTIDTKGRNQFELQIIDLRSGKTLEHTIKDVSSDIEWSTDNNTIFYIDKNPVTLREEKVFSFNIHSGKKSLLYHEKDEAFWVALSVSKSKKYLFIELESYTSTEVRYLPAEQPEAAIELFQERQEDLEYYIDHANDLFYILNNHEAINFKIQTCHETNTTLSKWSDCILPKQDIYIENFEIFNDYLVRLERTQGLRRFIVQHLESQKEYEIQFKEEVFNCGFHKNIELNTDLFRLTYDSLTTPHQVIEFHLKEQTQHVLKQSEVLGGYEINQYETKRIFVEGRDGSKIPLSYVYRKDKILNEGNPTLLYGYGSYGSSLDPYFSSIRLSLLDRGFIYAVAHVRGGAEMGRDWYNHGKLLNKKNTFYDFIDCADELVSNGITDKNKLYANGGSAGGLLMGAVMNLRPHLFHGICADVPFIDALTTMLDDSIPLTTGEYDEWGDPNIKEYYNYILSYSPYDQIEKKDYPHLLVTTGFHDSQVQYWEPAKWVAKLREYRSNDNLLLLKTDMDSGHGGASGRFEMLKDYALMYAFFLHLAGCDQ